MDQENSNDGQQEEKPKNKSPFHALIPKGDYFFTPILLNINILVFVAMVVSGVSPMLPDGNSLLKWGANFRPYTMDGEPWRLLTSMFLHFGLIHLAVNMFSLYSLGKTLEPFIGKWRFLLLYIFTGLGGSAVSLWWHDEPSVSAGASGAIFGLFGIFAAIVTTNLIEPTIRKQLLRGIGMTIGLNALIGLWSGIDNSAHLGGCLTGILGGYLIFFDLKAFYHRRKIQYTGLITAVVLISGLIVFFWMIIPASERKPVLKNEALLDHYMQEEKRSLDFLDKMDSTTTAEEIQKNAVLPWEHNRLIIDSLKANGLTEEGEKYVSQLKIYTLFRLKAADEYKRAVAEHRKDLLDSARNSMKQADNTSFDLQQEMNKEK